MPLSRPARPDQALSGRRDRPRRPDGRARAGDHRPRRRQRRGQEHAAADPARAPRRRRRGRATVLGYDVATQGTTLRQFVGYMPESDCLPPDVVRDRLRRPHGRACRACRRRQPASGRPRCCATSGCTRSATERSAATRPACASGSSSPRRSSTIRGCCCWTSRPTASTRPAVTRCSHWSGGPAPSSGSRSSSRATCSARSSASATSSSPSTPASCAAGAARHVHRADRDARGRGRGGRRSALADALVGAGLEAAVDGRTVLIQLDDERPWDLVRDAIADLGLPLVRIEQRRRGLEELFQ